MVFQFSQKMKPYNSDLTVTDSFSDLHSHRHFQTSNFDPSFSNEAFFDQMLSSIPSSSPWELDSSTASAALVNAGTDLGNFPDQTLPPVSNSENLAMMMMLKQQAGSCNGVDEGSSSFKCPNSIIDGSAPSLYNESPGSLYNQNYSQHLHHLQGKSTQTQNLGVPAHPRQKVRARRGQATDPHSIAERLRRERIAERTKALRELVPNANKTDKSSMLDEIIEYVKFLQLQVKVLSMSRLGGATGSMVADISSKGGTSDGAGAASSNEGMTVTEQRVAKLMEENMGSAMQYLQGKGLCLMPISLATAVSVMSRRSVKDTDSVSKP